MNTMRERFIKRFESTQSWADGGLVDRNTKIITILDFIEQELKNEREEIVEVIEHYLMLARYGNDDDLNPVYERAFEEIINIIKNRT